MLSYVVTFKPINIKVCSFKVLFGLIMRYSLVGFWRSCLIYIIYHRQSSWQKISESDGRHDSTVRQWIYNLDILRVLLWERTQPDTTALCFRGKHKIMLYTKTKCDQRDSCFGYGNVYATVCGLHFVVSFIFAYNIKQKNANVQIKNRIKLKYNFH